MSSFSRVVFIVVSLVCLSFSGLTLDHVGQAKVVTDFTDAPQEASLSAAVQFLLDKAVVQGYPDGTLGLGKPISRVETLALLIRSFPPDSQEDTLPLLPFSDIDTHAWYVEYIQKAYQRGLVKGYGDGTFGPGRQVTRGESYAFIVRMISAEIPKEEIPWYAPYVTKVQQDNLDLVPILYSGAFIQRVQTRGDVVRLLANALQSKNGSKERFVLVEEKGTVSYYADNLSGNGMSSGQKYYPYVYSAAHKTIGFDQVLQVIEPGSKTSVLVPVKDRGPHTRGFIVDLSRVGFEALASTRRGIFTGTARSLGADVQMALPKRTYDARLMDGLSLIREVPSYIVEGETIPFGIVGVGNPSVDMEVSQNNEKKIYTLRTGEVEHVSFFTSGDVTVSFPMYKKTFVIRVLPPFSGQAIQQYESSLSDVAISEDKATNLTRITWKRKGKGYELIQFACTDGANGAERRLWIVDQNELQFSSAYCPDRKGILSIARSSTIFAHDVYTSFAHVGTFSW